MSSTQEKVINIVKDQLQISENLIDPDKTLEELGADSVDHVEITMKLEEAFGKEISDKDAEDLTTINEIVDYMEK